MITEPEPTLVTPTSSPPSMPTSSVGIGRTGGFGSPGSPPERTRRRLMYSRAVYVAAAKRSAKPMLSLSTRSSSSASVVNALTM